MLPIFGEYGKPAKIGDTVVYWLNKQDHTHHRELTLYVSMAPYPIPGYMGIVWAYNIVGDPDSKKPVLRLEKIMHLLSDKPWDFKFNGLIEVSLSETFYNTVIIKYLEGEFMSKYIVLWDYTTLSTDAQINIINKLFCWHTSKNNLTLFKSKGAAIFHSGIRKSQIELFIEENYLHGKIWFIDATNTKSAWCNTIIAYAPSLLDSNMEIYTQEEMEIMVSDYKMLMGGKGK